MNLPLKENHGHKVQERTDTVIWVALTNSILHNVEFIISVFTWAASSKYKICNMYALYKYSMGQWSATYLFIYFFVLFLFALLMWQKSAEPGCLDVTIVLTCWRWLRRVAVHSWLQRKIKLQLCIPFLVAALCVDEDPFTRARTAHASACLFWINMLLRASLLFF